MNYHCLLFVQLVWSPKTQEDISYNYHGAISAQLQQLYNDCSHLNCSFQAIFCSGFQHVDGPDSETKSYVIAVILYSGSGLFSDHTHTYRLHWLTNKLHTALPAEVGVRITSLAVSIAEWW